MGKVRARTTLGRKEDRAHSKSEVPIRELDSSHLPPTQSFVYFFIFPLDLPFSMSTPGSLLCLNQDASLSSSSTLPRRRIELRSFAPAPFYTNWDFLISIESSTLEALDRSLRS